MLTRREFVGRISAAAAVVANAFAASAQNTDSAWPKTAPDAWINVGPVEAFPIDAATPVIRAKLLAKNLKMNKPELIVVRNREGVRVLSARCTHRGCTVQPDKDGFACPCHKSRFDKEGKPTHGPAKNALPWYDVSFSENGELLVNRAAVVQHGKPYPVPGADTSAQP